MGIDNSITRIGVDFCFEHLKNAAIFMGFSSYILKLGEG